MHNTSLIEDWLSPSFFEKKVFEEKKRFTASPQQWLSCQNEAIVVMASTIYVWSFTPNRNMPALCTKKMPIYLFITNFCYIYIVSGYVLDVAVLIVPNNLWYSYCSAFMSDTTEGSCYTCCDVAACEKMNEGDNTTSIQSDHEMKSLVSTSTVFASISFSMKWSCLYGVQRYLCF